MSETFKENKENKKNSKQLSITLPPDIYKKLEILMSSTPIPTTSGLIGKILMDFFNNSDYIKNTMELDSDSMLIPVNLYREVEGISPIGLQGRVDKGLIKIVKIGLADYVVEDKKSIKNIYLRLATINKQLKEATLVHMETYEKLKNYEEENDASINELKKQIKELQTLLPKKKKDVKSDLTQE